MIELIVIVTGLKCEDADLVDAAIKIGEMIDHFVEEACASRSLRDAVNDH